MKKCNILKIGFFLLATGAMHADTLGVQARTEDVFQQTNNVLFSGDQGMYLWGRANYCINTAVPPNGQYHFEFVIMDPLGNQVYSKSSNRISVPSQPMFIELREYALPGSFFTQHGSYTLTVSFIEEYGATVMKTNQSYGFQIESGARITDPTSPAILLQPMDGSAVTNYPNFVWTVPQASAGRKYNIYISENPSPNEYVYVQSEGMVDQHWIYSGIKPLRPGVRYYWNIRVTDIQGTPLGLNNGFSPTYSFTVNDIGVSDTISLVYPVNKIADSMPKFRWTTVFPVNVPAEYTLALSERIADNVIWQYTNMSSQYQYQADAPALKRDVQYFWKITGKNGQTGESKLSDTVSFTYAPVVGDTNGVAPGQTSVKGFIINDRDIAVMGATVYLKQLDATGQPLQFSLTSGPNGAFEIPDLPGGKYQLYSEIQMTNGFNNYSANIQIMDGIQNNLRIVMKNNLGRRTFSVTDANGWPVANVQITLKNSSFTWKFQTDAQGQYTLDLEDGVYNFEVSFLPQFSRTYQNGVYFSGVGIQNIRLAPTKNGATRVNITESGTNMGLENLTIEGTRK
jgi:hypothetical protein